MQDSAGLQEWREGEEAVSRTMASWYFVSGGASWSVLPIEPRCTSSCPQGTGAQWLLEVDPTP